MAFVNLKDAPIIKRMRPVNGNKHEEIQIDSLVIRMLIKSSPFGQINFFFIIMGGNTIEQITLCEGDNSRPQNSRDFLNIFPFKPYHKPENGPISCTF